MCMDVQVGSLLMSPWVRAQEVPQTWSTQARTWSWAAPGQICPQGTSYTAHQGVPQANSNTEVSKPGIIISIYDMKNLRGSERTNSFSKASQVMSGQLRQSHLT